MRKKQKKIIVWIAFCILCVGLIGGIAFGFKKSEQVNDRYSLESSLVRHSRGGGDPGIKSLDSRKEANDIVEVPRKDDVVEDISEPIKIQDEISPKALFKIDGAELEISITVKTSVYDAMKKLASEGKITFEGKEYPALGFFVTEINGLKSGGGKNLMYYINGTEASLGVSSYIIKEGDSIEWKLK